MTEEGAINVKLNLDLKNHGTGAIKYFIAEIKHYYYCFITSRILCIYFEIFHFIYFFVIQFHSQLFQ